MKRRFTRSISPALSVCLFALALLLIHRELKVYHYHDIVHQLRQVPGGVLPAALGLTILNYLVLTANDALALRHIRRRLPYPQLAFASFVGYAFSSNTTIVGGSAARYRIYSALGLSGREIAEMVLVSSYPVWLGFCLVAGASFVLQPPAAPTEIPISPLGFQIVGLICLAAIGVYMSAILLRRRPLIWRGWQVRVPAPALAVGQMAVTSVDWLLAAATLYVLLPDQVQVSYPAFLGLFTLGQGAAMISHVPGGLGVFETVLLFSLAGDGGAAALTAALLLYRVIYYLLPLLLGSLLLVLHEVMPQILSARTVVRLPLDAPD